MVYFIKKVKSKTMKKILMTGKNLETFLNYVKTVSNLDPHVMIRITPISLILIGYNFSNKRKVTHWFLPPFYKSLTESVNFNET